MFVHRAIQIQTGGLRTFFFEKDPLDFLDYSLNPWKFQTQFHPWKFHKIALHPAIGIGISKAKHQWPRPHGNSTIFFVTPGNSTSFFIDPWNFHILFFQFFQIPCPQHLVKGHCARKVHIINVLKNKSGREWERQK